MKDFPIYKKRAIPMKDFVMMCEGGGFIDYDGHGYLASETQYDPNVRITPSQVVNGEVDISNHSHVLWFNR